MAIAISRPIPALRTAALALLLLASGCATPLPLRSMACGDAVPPTIVPAADGQMATTTLSVLTYNIEGLGWPARSGREPSLRAIGDRIAALRAEGRAPDVILFQEMFSGAAKKAVAATGYPAIVTGPRRTTRAKGATKDALPGKSRFKRGELGLHLTGSGLAIASRYPIVHVDMHAYGRRSCAGRDCLANKGIVLARLTIPGVPTPIDIYDTHMNSRGASRAPAPRNLAAHDRQSLEASAFINRTHDDAYPVIFGGDFNMRHSEPRWENFSRYQSLKLVHRVCADPASGCDVHMSWDGDEPWMDTQDLQFFWPGDRVSIRPIRVEAMFDGGPSGPELSDHDAFLVTYQLSWRRTEAEQSGC
ncbi:endonuclease/exonuclease/phosphatase family protein [Sphingobium sp. BYY-5]|uniref:endonuclease/exonuclease/phosphatase family protein n=1 Tax=Sphingobium sp. BYY-5 TaxID=2926400 RepID=UPI001FA7C925|nr:endonuclease/exonuclease/phosphatase family protein [Sphingobium sp. BYY-5]MCI4591608.1 endonuclease/exonuclease/phosphatase family protein [Sphingobium sp. BYY-5]